VDWIELIPFSETRNYVQRVTENLQVYRYRLAGEPTPITLERARNLGQLRGRAAAGETSAVQQGLRGQRALEGFDIDIAAAGDDGDGLIAHIGAAFEQGRQRRCARRLEH
jgi:hypothetical protein